MMSGLGDLYQEVILDHSKRPRNRRKIEGASRTAEGYNPLCGDSFTVFLTLDDDRVKDVAFDGHGCAISTASASMMTEAVRGKTPAEAEKAIDGFVALVTSAPGAKPEGLGKLAIFEGVHEFPSRVKCATLAWHALRAALRGGAGRISTE
jgi:nitrogen fixation NifU-like protein